MKKVLWIPMMAPYDTVGHASGKIENYYLKFLCTHSDLEVTLLTLCKDFEKSKLDYEKYGIAYKIRVRKWTGAVGFVRRGFSWLSKFNLLNSYAGLTPWDIAHAVKSMIKEVHSEGYYPDCIILGWTEILFLLPEIQKYYPDVPVITIEEDVSYLGQLRRVEYSHGIKKLFYQAKYNKVKALELQYLEQVDLAILNNKKDYDLVMRDGLKNTPWFWSAYYESHLDEVPHRNGKDIVFYGAMFREENWKSAEWFIQNVMPLIYDPEVRFVIIGSHPNKKLFQYSSDRVVVKGFVEDVTSELLGAMCLAAPLVLGAGIKVKILEALSCGIPVLTNSIGIEGIPAKDGESFFYCETPQEYADVIEQLLHNNIDVAALEANAKDVIKRNFQYEEDARQFVSKVEAFANRKEGRGKGEL